MGRFGLLLALALASAAAGAAPDVRMLEGRISALEQRVAQGSGGRYGQVELVTQLQQLQEEVRGLRGQVEQNANLLEQLQKRQRELYLDLDRRLVTLEGGAPPEPAAGTTPPQPPAPAAQVPPPVASGAPPAPSAASSGAAVAPPPTAPGFSSPAGAPVPGGQDEQTAYRAAYDELRAGRYEAAIQGFRDLLARYPQGDLADNAQYWIGESYYVTRQYEPALAEFSKVVSGFPDSPKAADAELKIGFVYYNQGQFGQAREHLEAVVRGWPTTPAARLAQSHLRRMQEEGR